MQIARLIVLATVLLSACSDPVTAVTDYVRYKHVTSQATVARTKLAPGYDYLLVTIDRKAFLMARGAQEASTSGPVAVWFSGDGEVIKLQNGHVVAATGTPVEWSDVRLSSLPDWRQIDGPTTMERRRDVLPGYHFGLTDRLTVVPIDAPAHSAYFGKMPADLHWFKEVSSGVDPLPPAFYAVRFDGQQSEVMYGQQCLSKRLCFSWQRWPGQT